MKFVSEGSTFASSGKKRSGGASGPGPPGYGQSPAHSRRQLRYLIGGLRRGMGGSTKRDPRKFTEDFAFQGFRFEDSTFLSSTSNPTRTFTAVIEVHGEGVEEGDQCSVRTARGMSLHFEVHRISDLATDWNPWYRTHSMPNGPLT